MLPSDDTLIALGLIQKPRGLNGELLVKPYQDSSLTLRPGLTVSIHLASTSIDTKIEYVKTASFRCWIKFEGVDDRNQAEQLKGGEIFCVKNQLARLQNNEHFIFNLIGLKALDGELKQIGIVKDVISVSANDVLEIETNRGNILVPFIKEFVKEISSENKTIIIDRINELYLDEN